jgi:hypothetical protein
MVSPMLSGINLTHEEMKNSYVDMFMTDQEDESNFVLDLEMMYGDEMDSNIPNLEKQEREAIKQTLVDVMDLSMNEYSMHYILHSENEYMTPFKDLKSKIKNEFFKFYKSSCESMPFKLWSEVIDEHCKILSTFLPVTILKELYEYRINFVEKYTKNRIKAQLKKFSEKKSKKDTISSSMQVFNTNALTTDSTFLTPEEYLEMTVAEYINTPFHSFLVSILKKKCSESTILSLLAHIKEHEVDIMKIYNDNFEANSKFSSDMEFKNRTIEKYKSMRGFPLKLKPTEKLVYSMEDGISFSILEKIKAEKETQETQSQQEHNAGSDFSNSFSVDTDSCDDDMPFGMETEKVRNSNPEKRNSKFTPLCSLTLLKCDSIKDVEMSEEECKSKNSENEEEERPSFGNISEFIKSNMTDNKNTLDSCPFSNANTSLYGNIEKASNYEPKPSLLTTSMLRFSDLEKMEEDVEMEEIPEKLFFRK